MFLATGRTGYADEAATCRCAHQPYNLKDTEALRTPPVNPPVLRNRLQRVQVSLIKSVINLEVKKLPTESALGLKWNTEEDKFVWEVLEKILHSVNQKPMTRIGIVSAVYSLFSTVRIHRSVCHKGKVALAETP